MKPFRIAFAATLGHGLASILLGLIRFAITIGIIVGAYVLAAHLRAFK